MAPAMAASHTGYWRPDKGVAFAAAVFAVTVAVLSPNPLLAVMAVLVLLLIPMLTWRLGTPPVLPFVLGFQWLQAALQLLYAGVNGQTLLASTELSCADTQAASFYTLLGVLAVALGARLGFGQAHVSTFKAPRVAPAFWVYLLTLVLGSALQSLAPDGLQQIFLALANIHWMGYFLFASAVLATRRGYAVLIAVTGMELIIGLSGYFSAFKTPLFVLGIAMLASGMRFNGIRLFGLLVLMSATIFAGIVWQTVKGDYRNFVNRGINQQVVLVPFEERMSFLMDQVDALDSVKLAVGAESFVQRIAYVEIFGCVINRVPSRLPFAEGQLWSNALLHVTTPRLIYPNKPVLMSDSELTNHYTGLRFASDAEGTSVSIGYIGASYIDFGPWGMAMPLLLVGALFGWGARFCIARSESTVGAGMMVALLMGFFALEMDNVKLLGSYLTSIVAAWLILRFGAGALERWLQGGGQSR